MKLIQRSRRVSRDDRASAIRFVVRVDVALPRGGERVDSNILDKGVFRSGKKNVV